MGEEAPAWIAQTQQTLGSVVQKPKLTDNLLKKPPFRFLHDVVSATTKVSVLACPSQLLAYPSQLQSLWAISVSVCRMHSTFDVSPRVSEIKCILTLLSSILTVLSLSLSLSLSVRRCAVSKLEIAPVLR